MHSHAFFVQELEEFSQFVMRHPEMHFHVMVFSICSTVGQLYIFKVTPAKRYSPIHIDYK